MIEAGISVATVALLVISAMATFGATARAQAVQKDHTRAVRLARDLLADVLQQAYRDPQGDNGTLGPDSGEAALTAFDDVDDYQNYVQLTPTRRDGTTIPGFEGWRRQVSIQWVETGNLLDLLSNETGLKQIKVTVTCPSGLATSVTGLRSQYSAAENEPMTRVTYISGVTITIEGDPGTRTTVNTAATTLNQIPH